MRKITVRSLLCVSLSCMSLLSGVTASAAPPDDGTVAIARERFKEGVTFFDKKEYDKARLAFLQAYALKKHPAVLLNLAQSELRSGHEADAARHFSTYLREAKDATDAERQAAESGLNATKAAVGQVVVNVDEPLAEVYIDSSMEGLSPLQGPIYVNPGVHTAEARKGSKSAATQFNAAAGKQLSVDLNFAPKPLPPPPPQSSTAPETAAESAPPPEPAPDEASHGRKPFFKWLGSSPVGLVGLGLTGVGLGVGVGTALASKHSYNNADSIADKIKSTAATDSGMAEPNTRSLCTDPKAWLTANGYATSGKTPDITTRAAQYSDACAKYPDNVNSGDKLKTIATVSFVVSGVAAVGTILYYFLDPHAQESEKQASTLRRLAFIPSVGPAQTGLTVLGSF